MPQDSYNTALGEKKSTVAIGWATAPGSSLRLQQPPFFGDGAYFSEDAAPPGSPRQVGDAAVKAEIRARVGG